MGKQGTGDRDMYCTKFPTHLRYDTIHINIKVFFCCAPERFTALQIEVYTSERKGLYLQRCDKMCKLQW